MMLEPSNTSREWSDMTSNQIQDGGRPPFWKSKMRKNSAADRPIFTKFLHVDVEISYNLNFDKNYEDFKIKVGGRSPFW